MAEVGVTLPEVRSCTFADYCAQLRLLPRPTDEQVQNYVNYVSDAHSWYKHLPVFPPGIPFVFYLDPTAGCNRTLTRAGVVIEERVDRSQSTHYNWRTTSHYRSHFGHLAYDQVPWRLGPEGFEIELTSLPIFFSHDAAYRVPQQVAEASHVELTGAIHERYRWGWSGCVGPMELDEVIAPEIGDVETVKRLKELRLLWGKPDRSASYLAKLRSDVDLAIGLESTRLRSEMSAAIGRMLALVYEES